MHKVLEPYTCKCETRVEILKKINCGNSTFLNLMTFNTCVDSFVDTQKGSDGVKFKVK